GLPVAQLLLFGFAVRTGVRHLPTVVLDQSRTPPSRDLIAAFENTGNFRIIGYVDDRPALDRAIDRGDAQAGIVVPYDFPRRLVGGTTARVQVIVDAADPLSSQAAIAAAAGVTQSRNLAILSRAAGREEVPLEARVRPRYNPGLRSPNYIVPGLVGVILTITMVLITAMAIVREREPVVRVVHFDAGAHAAAGHAGGVLLRTAEHPAFGLHVPAPGDATAVPVAGPAPAAHALSQGAAGDSAEGRRVGGALAGGG